MTPHTIVINRKEKLHLVSFAEERFSQRRGNERVLARFGRVRLLLPAPPAVPVPKNGDRYCRFFSLSHDGEVLL